MELKEWMEHTAKKFSVTEHISPFGEIKNKEKTTTPEQAKIKTHKRFKRTLSMTTKTQSANFWGNSLYQATKQNLNNS